MASLVSADLSDCQSKAYADGYASEVYTDVRTEDGYVLSLFRITGKLPIKEEPTKEPNPETTTDTSETETVIEDSPTIVTRQAFSIGMINTPITPDIPSVFGITDESDPPVKPKKVILMQPDSAMSA